MCHARVLVACIERMPIRMQLLSAERGAAAAAGAAPAVARGDLMSAVRVLVGLLVVCVCLLIALLAR